MIKAINKKTQQYLVHAVLGNEIGKIKDCSIVRFERADDAGFLIFNENNVVVLLSLEQNTTLINSQKNLKALTSK